MKLDNSILNRPALASFDKFFSTEELTNTHTRVRNVIVHLATRDGFKDELTLHHVVTYGNTQPNCKKIDQEWMRIQQCGETALKYIDRWLDSMKLHRGMKLE